MSLFGKLKQKKHSGAAEAQAPCRHTELTPMWDNVADMGERGKISRYRCLSCQTILPPSAVDPAGMHSVT
jgi:hypothetical protein